MLRGFESHSTHQIWFYSSIGLERLAVNQQVVGSSPTRIAKFIWLYSSVVERLTVNQMVIGSNPIGASKF